MACVGGASGDDNAGHDQYNEKPGRAAVEIMDGGGGGSGYHDGQPPSYAIEDGLEAPCDHYDHYSDYSSGGSYSDSYYDNDCRSSARSCSR